MSAFIRQADPSWSPTTSAGSVAVLPILPDGRFGDATDTKQDHREDWPCSGDQCAPGQLCDQRARSDTRPRDSARIPPDASC